MSQLTQSQADGCDFHRGGVLYGGTIDRECRLGRGLVLEYQSRKAPPAYPARATLAQAVRFDAETARGMAGFNLGHLNAKSLTPIPEGHIVPASHGRAPS
jgi:hypothetical protein